MLEKDFQANFIKKLKRIFPGIMVLKNDAGYLQGVPDLTLLYNDRWAVIELKKKSNSTRRPNQRYYVDKLNEMSYAAFLQPSNEAEILNELQIALQPR